MLEPVQDKYVDARIQNKHRDNSKPEYSTYATTLNRSISCFLPLTKKQEHSSLLVPLPDCPNYEQRRLRNLTRVKSEIQIATYVERKRQKAY